MFWHAGHLVQTLRGCQDRQRIEGTCVLSALNSASSADSTWFELEACYWFSSQVLRVFKVNTRALRSEMSRGNLKSHNWKKGKIRKGKEDGKKSKELKRGGRKIDRSDNLRNTDTTTGIKEIQYFALNIRPTLQLKEVSKSRSKVPFDKSRLQLTG
jgi:hypothetical protein